MARCAKVGIQYFPLVFLYQGGFSDTMNKYLDFIAKAYLVLGTTIFGVLCIVYSLRMMIAMVEASYQARAILAREAELQSGYHRVGDWIVLPDKL